MPRNVTLTLVMFSYELLFTELQELTGDNGDGPNTSHDEALVVPVEFEAGDLGVAKWAQWPIEDLLTHLGFLGGRPVLFAKWRSQRGEQKYLDDVEKGDRAPVALLWHQAVAVAAMSEGFWTEKPLTHGLPGMLLADNVGLGKTVEIMALIAMIIQTRSAEQQKGGVRANIIGELSTMARQCECGALRARGGGCRAAENLHTRSAHRAPGGRNWVLSSAKSDSADFSPKRIVRISAAVPPQTATCLICPLLSLYPSRSSRSGSPSSERSSGTTR